MIEVEKKFQPTEEHLASLLQSADFRGEIVNHDIYYDYSDYRLLKNRVRLRSRNGKFELKIGKSAGVAEEIENDREIAAYFGITTNVHDFVTTELHPIIDYKTNRKKYLKEGFSIDVDKLDFGFNVCEIELLVENEKEIKDAEEKIIHFAARFNCEVQKNLSKRKEYLRLFNPAAHLEIYGE